MCNEFHNSLAQIPLLAYTCRMGKNYCIFRLAKAKTRQDVTNLLKEQHRAEGYDAQRADAERSRLNTYSCGFDEAMKIFDGLCPKKRRRNAVVALNFVISTSNEFPDAETEKKFYAAAADFLQKNLGQVVSWAIHRDETSTHFQAVTVPLVDGKLNARALCGGSKKKMQALQTRFWEEVGKPFGLERGEYNSKANHKTVEEFHREERAKLEAKAAEIEKKEAEVKAEKEAVRAEKKALEEREKAVVEKEIEVDRKGEILTSCARNLAANTEEFKSALKGSSLSRIKDAALNVYNGFAAVIERFSRDFESLKNKLSFFKKTPFSKLRDEMSKAERLGASTFEEYENLQKQQRRSRSSRGFGYD